MKKIGISSLVLFISSSLLLTANVSAQTLLPEAPSIDEIIEQTTMAYKARQMDELQQDDFMCEDGWSLQGVGIKTDQCKYAIKVPDKPTPGKIALTFDDGPSSATTPLVLDVLKAHNIHATFFVLGSHVRNNEALLQRMVEEGHLVGNHSYSHANYHTTPLEDIEREITTTENLLEPFAQDKLFTRFPYGNATCDSIDFAQSIGYKIVGWDIDTCDWAYATHKAATIQQCTGTQSFGNDFQGWVMNRAHRHTGGVMLMHDVHKFTVQNLDEVLTRLENEGFEFVLPDDLRYYPKLNQ